MQEEYLRMRLNEIVSLMNSLREEFDYSFDFIIGLSTMDLNEEGDAELTRMAVCTYDLIELYEEMDETFRAVVYDNFRKTYPSKAFQTDIENAQVLSKIDLFPYCLN